MRDLIRDDAERETLRHPPVADDYEVNRLLLSDVQEHLRWFALPHHRLDRDPVPVLLLDVLEDPAPRVRTRSRSGVSKRRGGRRVRRTRHVHDDQLGTRILCECSGPCDRLRSRAESIGANKDLLEHCLTARVSPRSSNGRYPTGLGKSTSGGYLEVMSAVETTVRDSQKQALRLSIAANSLLMAAEIGGGIVFGSLTLLADGVHMLSDVGVLSVALLAHNLMGRPASAKLTYGFQRAEVLGAQVNGLLLLAAGGWIFYTAATTLDEPRAVVGGGVLAIAGLGLVVNVVSAVLLARSRAASLNMRGAFLHMTLDAIGSLLAIVVGVVILLTGAAWTDSVASMLVTALVLWSAWRLLRDTTHVLLEGTPRGIDAADIEDALKAEPRVDAIHHLHLWSLSSDVSALSAHVVIKDEITLHDAQLEGDRLKSMLRDRFGIEHATLELECHSCEPPTTVSTVAGSATHKG